MKTIIQKPIVHLNTDYLPDEIRADILGVDCEDYDEIYEGNTKHLNDPIKIESLRLHLDTLEDLGANYVSIDFHVDHRELEFDGLLIREATQEEIDDHLNKDKDYQIRMIQNKIKELDDTKKQFELKLKKLSGE